MSNFVFMCPFCNQRLDCDEALENQEVNCPSCSNVIVPVRPDDAPAAVVAETPKTVWSALPPGEEAHESRLGLDDAREKLKNSIRGVMGAISVANDAMRRVTTPKDGKISFRSRILGWTAKDGSYKYPLLAAIYYYSAIGWFVISGILLAVGLVLSVEHDRLRVEPLIAVACMVFFAVVNLGIAQIINCIAKTACNTDRIVELLKDGKAEKR